MAAILRHSSFNLLFGAVSARDNAWMYASESELIEKFIIKKGIKGKKK
tara:strand:- start:1075 stop:1218 length:144 start_codon:yes stop_codon:yes gene_type:complete